MVTIHKISFHKYRKCKLVRSQNGPCGTQTPRHRAFKVKELSIYETRASQNIKSTILEHKKAPVGCRLQDTGLLMSKICQCTNNILRKILKVHFFVRKRPLRDADSETQDFQGNKYVNIPKTTIKIEKTFGTWTLRNNTRYSLGPVFLKSWRLKAYKKIRKSVSGPLKVFLIAATRGVTFLQIKSLPLHPRPSARQTLPQVIIYH